MPLFAGCLLSVQFSRGDAAGGSVALGKGSEEMAKAALNNAGPMGAAVVATVNVVEGAMGVANQMAPGLNAATSVGEVAGQAGYAMSKMGVGQFGRELASQMANDPRANSDNGVVRAAGVASQAIGKTMQAVDQTVSAAAQTANQMGQV